MRNILIASTFIFLSLLGTSCKRENTYLVEGVVVNRITQEPLEGVKMTLNDGLGVGGIFPSDEIEVSNVTYTDAQGKFKIQIKSKSNHAVLWLSKQGYEFQSIKRHVMILGFTLIPLALFLHETLGKATAKSAQNNGKNNDINRKMPD